MVPLIAWPLYAEQKMNAVFLSEVALRPKVNEDGLVGREDMMQGEKGVATHDRMIRLKGSCGQSSERSRERLVLCLYLCFVQI